MSDLNTLRKQVQSLNRGILELVARRSISIKEINKIKSKNLRALLGKSESPYPFFIPEIEIELYKKLSAPLKEITPEELLAFSLIIESQVRNNFSRIKKELRDQAYPHWFERTHIKKRHKDWELFERINPLLVSVIHPKIFKKLVLKSWLVQLIS